MPALTVTTRATNGGDAHIIDIGRGNRLFLQNISGTAEVVYFAHRAAVTATGADRGLRLLPGEYVASPTESRDGRYYITSDTDTAEVLYEGI